MPPGRPSHEADQQSLLAGIPSDGSTIGNTALRTKLGWTEDRYYGVRDRLVDAGQILLGRGRGGSVRRVVDDLALAPDEGQPEIQGKRPKQVQVATLPEAVLYAPILGVLQSEFKRVQRLDEAWFEITALQGRRNTGGKWTRPDIAGASIRRFKYSGLHLDVWTFEVKPKGVCDVSGVFEAAAHSRASTRSCVMFHQPDYESDARERVVFEAQRLGVGVIEFTDPANHDTWDVIVAPARRQPEPEVFEEFIEVQLSKTIKDKILLSRG